MTSRASEPLAPARPAGPLRPALSIATALVAILGAVAHASEAGPQPQGAADWAGVMQFESFCAMVGDDTDPDD